MCYSGKCRYETYMGDCTIHDYKHTPFDAACVQGDLELYARNEYETKKSDMTWEEFLEAFLMMERLQYEV